MLQIDVDGLSFGFQDTWRASKYDEWKFYRNNLVKPGNELKAVDVLAVDPDGTAWLIEVKDYTKMDQDRDARPMAATLARAFAKKVFDTLAAILPAGLNAPSEAERNDALAVRGAKRLRVVLHIEQPVTKSRLRPRSIDPAHIQQKIRQLLKPVDPHPVVVAMARMGHLSWTVVRP